MRRKNRIGVQKENHRAARHHGASVHLLRSATGAANDLIGEWRGMLKCRVAAAAINDDQLVTRMAQWLQRVEEMRYAIGFVENGDDDGQAHS